MPTLETIGFIPQVAPLVILLIVSLVLNVKLFLPTVGQIFAVRKQSSYVLTNEAASTTPSSSSSLSTSIFSSPGSMGPKADWSSLQSVLQNQFSSNVNTDLLHEVSASRAKNQTHLTSSRSLDRSLSFRCLLFYPVKDTRPQPLTLGLARAELGQTYQGITLSRSLTQAHHLYPKDQRYMLKYNNKTKGMRTNNT